MRMMIRQYAYGLMRIDDGESVTNVQDPGKDKNGNPIIYKHTVFDISAEDDALGQIQPKVYLPDGGGALYIDGQNITVEPLQGGIVPGRTLYDVPLNSEVWCAVTKNAQDRLTAKLYLANQLPPNPEFAFPVASVPMNPRMNRVTQYAYGTVFLSTGGNAKDNGAFKIVSSSQALSASARGARSGTTTHHFENCYYMNGNVLNEIDASGTTVESFAGQFVCLKVPATASSGDSASLIGYSSYSELHEAQTDPAYVVTPLYKLDAEGAVDVDFRNCPTTQVAEVL